MTLPEDQILLLKTYKPSQTTWPFGLTVCAYSVLLQFKLGFHSGQTRKPSLHQKKIKNTMKYAILILGVKGQLLLIIIIFIVISAFFWLMFEL